MPDSVGTAKGKKLPPGGGSIGNLKATVTDQTGSVSRIITHKVQTDRKIKNAERIVAGGHDSVKKKLGAD